MIKKNNQFFKLSDSNIIKKKQLKENTHKFVIAKFLIDDDPEKVMTTMKQLSNLEKNNPKLNIISAHNYKYIREITSLFPKFIYPLKF